MHPEPEEQSLEATRTLSPQGGASADTPAVWGQLQIRAEIGRGGFGSVYRAWDPTLEREVALKLFHSMSPGADLHAEGKRLARLRHVNVVQVYGVAEHDGRAGLWMEFIHGRTLTRLVREQGRLGAHEATALTLEVCRAVAAVHAAGLLHRDIKAQNVMREDGGRIVLMDFGLTAPQSEAATLAGTPVCMAPELLRGEPASPRSDIYALGVLLYFLVTGRYPYESMNLAELIRQQQEGKLALLRDLRQDLPREFVAVVERAMAFEAEARFATVGELEAALAAADRAPGPRRGRRWMLVALAGLLAAAAGGLGYWKRVAGPTPRTGPTVVAVLPFENLTGDPKDDYIGSGIGEEISDWLGKTNQLRVIARDSAQAFRGAKESAVSIGQKLKADWLITGTVRRDRSRVRVRVQVVQASDGTQKLSEMYEYDMKEPMQLQEQIGGALSALLNVQLDPYAAGFEPEARDLFWQAEEEGRQMTPKALRASAQLMERVAALAPRNPMPLIQLASNYVSLAAFSGGTREDAEKAKEYLERAFRLDPEAGRAHELLAFIKYKIDWDWAGAEKEYELAARRRPSSTGYAFLLAQEGRLDDARRALVGFEAIDPLSYQAPHVRSLIELFAGNYREAEQYNSAAVALSPRNMTRIWRRGQIRSLLGRHAEAIEDLRLSVEKTAAATRLYEGALGWALARSGQTDEARRILARLRADPKASQVEAARIYAALGDPAAAIACLERAYAERDPMLDTLWVDPFWKPLRGRPAYRALVDRMFAGVRLTAVPD